jgi:hypothetical protein
MHVSPSKMLLPNEDELVDATPQKKKKKTVYCESHKKHINTPCGQSSTSSLVYTVITVL